MHLSQLSYSGRTLLEELPYRCKHAHHQCSTAVSRRWGHRPGRKQCKTLVFAACTCDLQRRETFANQVRQPGCAHLMGRPSGSCWGAPLRPLPSAPFFSAASSSSTSPPSSAWNLLSRLSEVPSCTTLCTSVADVHKRCASSLPCCRPPAAGTCSPGHPESPAAQQIARH